MKKKLFKATCLSLTLSSILLSACSNKVDDNIKEINLESTKELNTVGFGGDSNIANNEVDTKEDTSSSLQSINKPLESNIKEIKENKKEMDMAKIDLVTPIELVNPLYVEEFGEERQYDYFKLALPDCVNYAGMNVTGPITNSFFYQGDIENYKNFVIGTMSSIDFVSEGLIEEGEIVNFEELSEEDRINYLKKFKLEGVSGMTPYNIYTFENKGGLPFHVIDFVDSDGLYGSVAYSIKNNICFINMVMSDISISRASDFNYFLSDNAIYNMEPVSEELNISFDRLSSNDGITFEDKSLDGFEKNVLIDEFFDGSLTINGYKFKIGETTVSDIEKFNYNSKDVDEYANYYEFKVDSSNTLYLTTLGNSDDSKLNYISLYYHMSDDNIIECDLLPWCSTLDDVKEILSKYDSEFMDTYYFELDNNIAVEIGTDDYLGKELVSTITIMSYE